METKSLVLTEEDIKRGLKATPEQRLAWLEEANEFVRKVRPAGRKGKGR